MKSKLQNFKWKKCGLLITPQKDKWWMQTHAMLPTVDHISGNVYRVYFSGRDNYNRSHISYAEIEVHDSLKVITYAKKPILNPGDLGCFDDSGVTPSWLVTGRGQKYLYYIGWNQRSRVRMSLVAGLAISRDGGNTFTRYSPAPLLERTGAEPLSILTAPCVLKLGRLWRMWYVSGIDWVHEDLPRYNIKYAQSKDGIHWVRNNFVCIDFKSPEETALARPCVLFSNNTYHMWYAYKGKDYRLGYAQSMDGLHWKRLDKHVGMTVSLTGWDSHMVEYAYVFRHNGKTIMLYNGDDYGKGGIGYAILEAQL